MTIIETPIFTRLLKSSLSDDDYRELQNLLISRPEAGNVMRGSGGIRKLRWAGSGRGKRGGVRVIYYMVFSKRNHSHAFHLSQKETGRFNFRAT